MPLTKYSPPKSSSKTRALNETQSVPDISTTGKERPYEIENITTRPGKRFRGDDVYSADDKFEELKNMLQSWKVEQDTILNKLVAEVAELKQHNISIQKTNLDIEKAMNFINKGYEDMKGRLEAVEKAQNDYETRLCETSRCGPNETILELEAKIDAMEQHSRQSNIEICNLPEKRNENLLSLMASICNVLNYSVPSCDIISIHRVPHAHRRDGKPKNIIVKLKSKIIRDNLISAYRKIKTVKTDQLDISGVSVPIYINEHLTLKNKLLFRKTREAARKNGFKFVWLKNGTILARERDGSQAFAIRTDKDLGKFQDKAGPSNKI